MIAAAYTIKGGDYENGGAAARQLKQHLKQIGADPAVVRRAMIAAYEAEMNVVIHSHGGELRARLDDGQLDVEVVDTGPGIPDIERALRPGFSTAPQQARELGFGAGMGLPNIKKASDRFTLESTAGGSTRIAFTVFLKPQALYGAGRHSLRIMAERCCECRRCLHACPTAALRVFRGRPEVLDYLCVDCGACLAACPTGALALAATPDTLVPAADVTLVVPPACLVEFGAGTSPARVLAELKSLGFADVIVTDAWKAALRSAVRAYLAESPVRPVIAPLCPAVVALVEARFPALLPNLAPFLSEFEAVQAAHAGRKLAFVVSCACQRTVLLAAAGKEAAPDVVAPAAFRALLEPLLAAGSHKDEAGVAPAAHVSIEETGDARVLRVCGIAEVRRVLEQIEDGRALDVEIVEAYACPGAGFGPPLLREPAALARHRWRRASGAGTLPQTGGAHAQRRATSFAARPGLRLDPDMRKAIQKLGRIDKLTRSLPGYDCALCGAPTCAALAEDIVLGRASPDACRRAQPGAPSAAPQAGPTEAPDAKEVP